MAITMVEIGAQYSKDQLKAGSIKTIAQNSSVLDRIKNKQFNGNAYTFTLESALPAAQWRAVGGSYTRATGARIKVTENVAILGNEIFIDNFELKVAANKKEFRARKFSEGSRSLALAYDETFFEGSTHTDPLKFDGLRTRITGNQLLTAGANGAALTLPMLDQLLDTVTTPDKIAYMCRKMRRAVTYLARTATGTVRVSEPKIDAYGKQVVAYNEVPILLVERTDDGSTILDFDETQGTETAAASIYVVSFGDEEKLFGLMGAGGDMEVKDLGESEVSPGVIGRVEFYPGVVIAHPRCVGRLRGLTMPSGVL